MRLAQPCQGIDFRTKDIYGEPFQLSDLIGKRVLLSFFRDAACPFCNFRVYELTHKYKAWQHQGLEIVTVFSSPSHEVKTHVARHPRPFTMLSDPELAIYNRYGVEHSTLALFKALFFRFPRIVKSIAKGGRPRRNKHPRIVPADFLLEEDGRITQLFYGRNTSDHMPMSTIQMFIDQGQSKSVQAANLQEENRRLKQEIELLKKRSIK